MSSASRSARAKAGRPGSDDALAEDTGAEQRRETRRRYPGARIDLSRLFLQRAGLGKLAVEDLTGFRKVFLEPRPLFYSIVRKLPGPTTSRSRPTAYLPPIPIAQRCAPRGVAYVNLDLDTDGAARSYPTVIRFNHQLLRAAISRRWSTPMPTTRRCGLRFDAGRGCRVSRIGGQSRFRSMSSAG